MPFLGRVLLLCVAITLGASAVASAQPAVSVFPSPGTQSSLPGTQITFRGVPASSIGTVEVVGSKSGLHAGTVKADSDGDGGSFLLDKPLIAGEKVTVTTGLNIIGGHNGAWQFTVGTPWGQLGVAAIPMVPAGSNGALHFRSRPDLTPAAVSVTTNKAPASYGDVFIAPQDGPLQNGPELLSPTGHLIWFQPIPKNTLATDFRVQQLYGQPVLTWWEGTTDNGSGRGEGVIFNSHYQEIGLVKAANGLAGADLHEFLVTNNGDAYIVAASPLHFGNQNRPLIDSVVQEIDIKTGLVLFEWHSNDHIPISESFFRSNTPGHVYDPWHLNSISIAGDGNLIVSMRNTWAVYKINHETGAVMWTLGSSKNNFKRGAGVATAFQHDVIAQPDGSLTIFDDGAGPPNVHSQSRAVRIALNTKTMTATLVKQYFHSPPLLSIFEGNAQLLPGGDVFMGWGSVPDLSEDNSSGQQDYDAHFNVPTSSYRAYRFQWNGQPLTNPAVALSRGPNGVSTISASWNGATSVNSWTLLSGSSPNSLAPVASVKQGGLFESNIQIHSEQPYFAVQAVNAGGGVTGRSNAIGSAGTRLSIFGHTGWVSPSGGAGMFVGCFSSVSCHVTATISAGRTVIARTGTEQVPANNAGIVFYGLTSAGRSMLGRARDQQLNVTANVRNSDGASTSSGITLTPFGTGGKSPAYTSQHTPGLQLYARTSFANSSGFGGVFAGCFSSSPCHATTTVTAGKTVIAQSGKEFIGANDYAMLLYQLTSAGKSMMLHDSGNQLPVKITISDGHDTATSTMAIVRFGPKPG